MQDFISFKHIYRKKKKDLCLSDRSFNLMMYRKVLDGKLYDILSYDFHQVVSDLSTPESVPLSKRRPMITYWLTKSVVDDMVSLLFGEDKFPKVVCAEENKDLTNNLNTIIKDSFLQQAMIDAATRGSVGSAVVLVKVVQSRVFYEVIDTEYLTPIFNPDKPDQLIALKQKYKISGGDLACNGYEGLEEDCDYWYEREWNINADIVYVPYTEDEAREDDFKKKIDKARSFNHNLGFVPAVWIKNLPGGTGIDGLCTFNAAININIAIDYQLSQVGRGYVYSAEPLLVITDGEFQRLAQEATQEINATEGNILTLGSGADAKYLEIDGEAGRSVIEYVKFLRQIAMENIHGNKSNPERMHTTQSGVAVKSQNQSLIWVADKLRVTYGEFGVRSIINILRKLNDHYPIYSGDDLLPVGSLSSECGISLIWNDWYSSTPDDRSKDANTYKTLKDAGLISQKTALSNLSAEYEIDNIDDEIERIKEEKQAFTEEFKPKVTETINI